MEMVEGLSVGRYLIKGHIAQGGMSSLYHAYDPLLGRDVAVKILKKDLLSQSENFRDMFEEEASIMSRLEHPNVLPVYDYGIFDELPFYVVRLIDSGTLEQLLQTRRPPLLDVIKIVERLASAIDYFHAQGIVHRDLKPANILIDKQNHPYITDFGLTHIPTEFKEIIVGSPFYMSPEQWERREVGAQSDLFAFGMIVFQCLTGRYPVPSGLDPSSAADIKAFRTNPENKQLPSIRKFNPHIPLGVELVLDKLTHFDPDQRFVLAGNAADALLNAFYTGRNDVQGKLFISYSHVDAEYVTALADRLINAGIEVWIDRNIHTGRQWDRVVEKALDECDKMLVILSPASVVSDNVRDEWSYYLDKGKEVYPILYQDCDVPFRLKRRQYIHTTGDTFIDVSKIIGILSGGAPSDLLDPDADNALLDEAGALDDSLIAPDLGLEMSRVRFMKGDTTTVFHNDEEYESPKRVTATFGENVNLQLSVKATRETIYSDSLGEKLTLGRGKAADYPPVFIGLTAFTSDIRISRKHASIYREDALVKIVDENSTNGTFLNGQRLLPSMPRILRDGDDIQLGDTVFIVAFVEVPTPEI